MPRFYPFAVVGIVATAGVALAAPNPLAKVSPARLVSQGQQLAREARTLSADMIVVYEGGDHVTASVRLMKPNYLRITPRSTGAIPRLASDGEWSYVTINGSYLQVESGSSRDPLQALESAYPPLAAFLKPELLTAGEASRTETPFGVATGVGREEYVGVETRPAKEGVAAWYFNEQGLAAGARLHGSGIKSVWLQNVTLDLPMQPKEFLYRVPIGFHPVDRSKDGGHLLAVGTEAPEISLAGADGSLIRLSDLRKTHGMTLVQFWSHASPRARPALTQIEALHKELRAAGLGVLAINVGDSAEAMLQLRRELDLTFPIMGGRGPATESVAQSYAVTGGVGSYLIDREGRILWRAENLDVDAVRQFTRTLKKSRPSP